MSGEMLGEQASGGDSVIRDDQGIAHQQPIGVDQIDYSGAGTWASGHQAVVGFINQALDIKGLVGADVRQRWITGMSTLASRESGENSPRWQVNTTDSNATGPVQSDGAPLNCSRGCCQTIPGTFAAHHQPGTSTQIYDPVANIAAAINYILNRYDVLYDGTNLAANVQQADPGRPSAPYASS